MRSSKVSTLLVLILLFAASGLFSQLAQNGSKGLLRTHSAQTLGKGVLGIGVGAYYGLDNGFIQKVVEVNPDSSKADFASGFDKPTYLSTFYNVSYGLLNFWDIGLTLPFYVDNNNIGNAGSDNGIGDLSIAMKIQYPPYEHSHVFDMTYYGQLFLPTASEDKGLFPRQPYYTTAQNVKSLTKTDQKIFMKGLNLKYDNTQPESLYNEIQRDLQDSIPSEHNYYGAGSASFLAKMLWTFDASEINPDIPLKWHLNFGALFTGKSTKDNIFELGSMIEWTPHPVVTLFTDFYGQARFSQLTAGFDLGKEPLILGSGLCFNIPGGAHISVAMDNCFSLEKYHTIYYNESKNQAYETKIFPNLGLSVGLSWTGSIMGGDADKDGIPDKLDNCPDEPEDVDGYEDQDGCPDYDNDKDGIPDSLDKCQNDPEDVDGYEDKDGCPDIDNDKDGIPDSVDKCPNQPENFNGFQDQDGCPDVKAKEIDQKMVLEGVNFKTGSAELTYESGAILDKIIESLVAYPEICIEIQGHTDNVGTRAKNRQLSLDRANSVKSYMVSKSVDPKRIRTQGMGPDVPTASNAKADGRAKNRRIELYRVNCN